MRTLILLGALLAGLVVAARATAAEQKAEHNAEQKAEHNAEQKAEHNAEQKQAWIKAELVDRHGRPSGRFIDSRDEGRTLMVNLDGRFHYLRHVGVDLPNTILDIIYVDPVSTVELHRESTVTRRSGAFASAPLDLRTLLEPGSRLTVGVHHAASEPTVAQDLIEYVLLAAVVP